MDDMGPRRLSACQASVPSYRPSQRHCNAGRDPLDGRTAMTDRSQRKPARAQHRPFPAHIHRRPRRSRRRRRARGEPARSDVGHAQGAPLKVGVLLPRSGVQAGIGQDCQRGVEIAAGILKDLKLPELAIMNGDTQVQRRGVPRPRRAPDQRGRAAARRRLRLPARPRRSRRWPSRRAFRSSSTSPPPRPSPSRATSSCSATSRPRR